MAERKKGLYNTRKLTAELRDLDIDELEKRLAEKREELMRDRFRHASANLENTALLRRTRTEIARIATVITEKRQAACAAGLEEASA